MSLNPEEVRSVRDRLLRVQTDPLTSPTSPLFRDALKVVEDQYEEIARLKAREALVREELRHWRAQLVADEPLLPRQVDAVLEQVAP